MKTFLSIVLLIALLNISGGFATSTWYVCPGSGSGSSPSPASGGSTSPPASTGGSTTPPASTGGSSSPPASATTGSSSDPTSVLTGILGSTTDTPFSTIEQALKAAKEGDIINLLAGVYSGSGNTGLQVNIANIQILGIDVGKVFIDLEGSPIFLNITVPGVVVAQVTIQNGINANVNVLNGVVTANVHVGCINVNLAVALNLDPVKILNVKFLNIQGTAVAVVDLNILHNTVNVNLNIFLNVVISSCSFINVTAAPAVFVTGQISVRLSNVNFQNCGSSADPDLLGVVLQALKGSVVTLTATVNLDSCIGGTLIDLDTAASVNLGGTLNIQACVAAKGLLNLNANLQVNILGLSISLNGNTYTQDCLNCPSCGIINIGLICGKYACPLINLGGILPMDNFFY